MAVNVVANLLALVAKNRILPSAERHLHQIGQKTVQLYAGVGRPRQAATAKDSHLHSEVTPIFLRGKVRRRFRSAKKRMQRLVDPASLADTLKILGSRVIVPLLQLFQRDLIRRISINLVGAKKNEHRVG